MRNPFKGAFKPHGTVGPGTPPGPQSRPRPVTESDVYSWMTAADARPLPLTQDDFMFLLDDLHKSDRVRVWRIRKDMQWLKREAERRMQ